MGIPAILTGENCIVTVPLYALSLELLAEKFQVSRSQVTIYSGQRSRLKYVEIDL